MARPDRRQADVHDVGQGVEPVELRPAAGHTRCPIVIARTRIRAGPAAESDVPVSGYDRQRAARVPANPVDLDRPQVGHPGFGVENAQRAGPWLRG